MTRVEVQAGAQRYAALIGSGLLDRLGELVAETIAPGRCAIISDTNVAVLFAPRVIASLERAGFAPELLTVPAGEASKSLTHVARLIDDMIAAGLDRSSFVVALGGGVVGDLAGFVAAIYQRGIPFVQVPTTMMAQVDSSVGGKTGINAAAGKNLIGSFHQPLLVVADVETLHTLPAREWNEGFAEVIKHAIIRDRQLFETLANTNRASDMVPLIRRNVEIKAAIVAADERETSGERALLNFGHTVGHAIETAAGYGTLLHGEAISLGIVAAAEISVRHAGLAEVERAAMVTLLEHFSLPVRLPADISRERIFEALARDKKFERGAIRFVVTPAIGRARLTSDVTLEAIRAAVAIL